MFSFLDCLLDNKALTLLSVFGPVACVHELPSCAIGVLTSTAAKFFLFLIFFSRSSFGARMGTKIGKDFAVAELVLSKHDRSRVHS